MSVILYPRLFTSRHREGDGVVVSSGDETIELLYSAYLDKSTNTRSWTYYRSALSSALRVFGDLHNWFDDQALNPTLPPRNREFVLDTLKFIQTGSRDTPTQVWIDLLEEGGKLYHAHQVDERIKKRPLYQTPSATSVQLLHSWVSKPNGMEDLITSMHLLFGKARAS